MRLVKRVKDRLYIFKEIFLSVFIYPEIRKDRVDYKLYWETRGLGKGLNSFQERRAEFVLEIIKAGSTVLDIGGGDGRVLAYINERKPMKELIDADIAGRALEAAENKGLKTIRVNIMDLAELNRLPKADYILLFEVIEHIPHSEELLTFGVSAARVGTFFSVPNTGFFSHRLRLLFGKFPLQWRVDPSEHVRFWTLADMRDWLKNLGFRNCDIRVYEGIPILNRIWPSLFGQGIFVYIPSLA